MDQYAVIGNPVAHSLSPFIHAEFARQTGDHISYTRIEAPLESFLQTVKTFQQQGGRGVNVTVPFKRLAFELADEKSEMAREAEAANTLLFRQDGTIFADNTDGTGLIQDLTNNQHYSLRQKKILLLGAGGAARGVVCPLLCSAPAALIIANRTAQKAYALAERHQMKGEVRGIGLAELDPEPYDLIINATSSSLHGEAIDLPNELIGERTWVYDITYGKQNMPFLQWARDHGATKVLDGLGMLVEQAAASFYLWRGEYPETAPVIEALQVREQVK